MSGSVARRRIPAASRGETATKSFILIGPKTVFLIYVVVAGPAVAVRTDSMNNWSESDSKQIG